MGKLSDFGFINESTAGGGGNTYAPYYGSFYDTTDQSATLPDTAYAMQLNSIDATCTSGFTIQNNSLGNPTRIRATYQGVYNLQFSAQAYRGSGGTNETLDIWFRQNELDIPNSTTKINISNNTAYFVASWNFFVNLNAGQYVEIMWSVSTTQISLQYDPSASPHPAIPSVIATICKLN